MKVHIVLMIVAIVICARVTIFLFVTIGLSSKIKFSVLNVKLTKEH